MKISNKLCLICSAVFFSASANAIEICGSLNQGEIVVGKITQGSEAYLNGTKIDVDETGAFLAAFGRDEKDDQLLSIVNTQREQQNIVLPISPTQWNIQNIKGVPPRKVNPSDSDLAAINKENSLLGKAFKTLNSETFWRNGFIKPVEGRISGEFGGQRIMNKVPKSPHRGMDIATAI